MMLGPVLHFSSVVRPFVRGGRRGLLSAWSHHHIHLSSVPNHQKIKSVAVLGGGISGLSAAWYMSKFAPTVPIVLYEKSRRVGGWLDSKRINYNGGSILFEQGPRTLRPWSINGMVTLDMIRQLKLEEKIAITPKFSPAAKNRFIYYPDRLNQLPNSILSTILSPTLPVMKGVISGIFKEVFRKQRSLDLQDESVGSFMSRRFSPNLSQNIISAVLHGIYAGDVDRLSVKSLFPKLWRDEAVHKSLVRGIFTKKKVELYDDVILRAELYASNFELMKKIRTASVYSFKGGIETLSRALVAELNSNPNVTIKSSTNVTGIKYSAHNDDLPFEIAGGKHSHVISTLFGPVTNTLLPLGSSIPMLAQMEAVTVLVVNLYFAAPDLLPVEGFGYLLPKSLTESENPHKALGVIFDSCATPQLSEMGTKVTVMIGGHHWTGRTSYPSTKEAIAIACDVLKQHLKIEAVPVATNVALNRDCIPQYNVGHDERMKSVREALVRSFSGRLSVVGASYRGVGLNDCIRSSRDVVAGMLAHDGNWTGLEGMGEERRWVPATMPPARNEVNKE